jgi:hypothetical protein
MLSIIALLYKEVGSNVEWAGGSLTLTMKRGGEPIGLNPSIRIYRYTKGQFFDCHCTLLSLTTPSCHELH